MSPEQIKGNDPAPQMDIYALGIVLFEMLTGGERPFTGENAKTTGTTSEKVRWEQLRMAAPPPSSYIPTIAPSMDAIVLKCLDKSPANRYLSAMDLYGDLVTMGNAPVQPKPVQIPVPEPQPQTSKAETLFDNENKLIIETPIEAPETKKTSEKSIASPTVFKSTVTRKTLKVVTAIGVGLFFLCVVVSALSRIFSNGVSLPQAGFISTPTYTPRPTSTKIPSTPTKISPTQTKTSPTQTKTSPTPTPASLGEFVKHESLEISVLDIYRHDKLIPGNGYRYWANDGYMIIDLVVKVQNIASTPTSITWNDAYVIDDTGARNDILFAGSRPAAKTEKIDPLSIDYNTIDGAASTEIKDTVYMRIIYIIPDKPEQMVVFGIKDSPLIGFTVKK
jgi:serine/threonine protein kinase